MHEELTVPGSTLVMEVQRGRVIPLDAQEADEMVAIFAARPKLWALRGVWDPFFYALEVVSVRTGRVCLQYVCAVR